MIIYRVMVSTYGGPHECMFKTEDKYEAYEYANEHKWQLEGRCNKYDIYVDSYEDYI